MRNARWLFLTALVAACGASNDAESCREQGGIPLDTGRSIQCALPTSDGGEACSGSSTCEGYCAAPSRLEAGTPSSGVCSDYTMDLCEVRVENGRVESRPCI